MANASGRENGMSDRAPTAAEEWKANWGLVVAAMLGLSFGSVPAATLGLFMEPLEAEFGWSRAMISGGMMMFAAIGLPLTPFAGALADKVGSRACVIPGLAACGIAFAAFGLMTGAPLLWWAIWVVYALASLLIRSMIWNAEVSKAFETSRGLAIALVLSGFALAQVIAPPLTHFLITSVGWRAAYVWIGLGWAGVGLAFTVLFFRSAQARAAAAGKTNPSSAPRAVPGGLTLGQAMRNPAMIRIFLAIFLSTLMGAAVAIHFVPLMEWAGANRTVAATVAGLLGVGSLCGKLMSGWLVDRITSGFLRFAIFALPAVGYLLIWQSDGIFLFLALGGLFMGFGSGGALQMGTYLTTRYGGMRNFGTIFGVISSAMGLSGGVGPVVSGWIYDTTGSYALVLLIAIPSVLAAGLLLVGLGAYPQFEAAAQKDDEQ